MTFVTLPNEIADNIFSYSINEFLDLDQQRYKKSHIYYRNLYSYASVSQWWRSMITSQVARGIGKQNEDSIWIIFDKAVSQNRLMSLRAVYESGKAASLSVPRQSLDPGLLYTNEEHGLCEAIKHRSTAAIQFLIDRGVSVDASDFWGGGALQACATHGNEEAAQLLLKNGANVNLMRRKGSPLHYAVDYWLSGRALPVMYLLLNSGADVSARAQDNQTPLHRAAASGLTEEVKCLLDYGARIEDKWENRTALMIASEGRRAKTTQVLLERGADVSSVLPATEYDSLCLAVTGSSTPAPARLNTERTIKLLIEYGADVDGNAQNVPPLSLALMQDSDLQFAIVEALLDSGADVEKADCMGLTPLETLISKSGWYNTDGLHLLLERGVNVNKLNKESQTPIFQACAAAGDRSMEQRYFIIQTLIDYKADVNQADDKGDTPALAVCANEALFGWQKHDLLQLLLENGANTRSENREGETLRVKARRHFGYGTKERRDVLNLISRFSKRR